MNNQPWKQQMRPPQGGMGGRVPYPNNHPNQNRDEGREVFGGGFRGGNQSNRGRPPPSQGRGASYNYPTPGYHDRGYPPPQQMYNQGPPNHGPPTFVPSPPGGFQRGGYQGGSHPGYQGGSAGYHGGGGRSHQSVGYTGRGGADGHMPRGGMNSGPENGRNHGNQNGHQPKNQSDQNELDEAIRHRNACISLIKSEVKIPASLYDITETNDEELYRMAPWESLTQHRLRCQFIDWYKEKFASEAPKRSELKKMGDMLYNIVYLNVEYHMNESANIVKEYLLKQTQPQVGAVTDG